MVGEIGLDRFIYCDCKRIAPDGPWPVVLPIREKKNAGLAANCYENLRHFAPDWNIMMFGPKGNITKTRYIDEKTNHCFIRVDENDSVDPIDGHDIYNCDALKNKDLSIHHLDAIVISDYNKGFLTKQSIEYIAGIAKSHGIPLFLDTKFNLGPWSQEVTFVKINEKEYRESSYVYPNPEKYCKNLIVTLGKNGAYLPLTGEKFATKDIEVADSTGCGDTFMAALVVSYIVNGNNLNKAIETANRAATHKATLKGISYFSLLDLD